MNAIVSLIACDTVFRQEENFSERGRDLFCFSNNYKLGYVFSLGDYKKKDLISFEKGRKHEQASTTE